MACATNAIHMVDSGHNQRHRRSTLKCSFSAQAAILSPNAPLASGPDPGGTSCTGGEPPNLLREQINTAGKGGKENMGF
ncbi:hypothetical protein MCOR02_002931 [Pyricularia oryzae]|uniref:Uncharacterized protein n=4 Tax=Pyricularia TaxID=48558 RepID=A0ABQ8NWB5_PYRGI|nr:uncharacterized protein MGG_15827 [Pyricularia oryzae 70-15]ELQ44278.1 hypothetical protein OOU_Y34scaffold00094g68 [Pyricularia oryzae Y34]KAH8839516.1 hypothetical protein MCOR01_008712 [Pyricularia oryzae]KAI6303097.1 hypothetical protein MCOR33_001694 [Pyricularia grisea]EHA55308.1 hypothetical protein MGG_15827 [Pyricularia oryzae 70-15]KAH9439372.1 hypothetical protein MCOR02_002931 [Pyricularia oryzae]